MFYKWNEEVIMQQAYKMGYRDACKDTKHAINDAYNTGFTHGYVFLLSVSAICLTGFKIADKILNKKLC